MKRKFDYILLLLAFLLIRCGEPLPTELISDTGNTQNEDFTVEVVSPNPGDIDYSNGYDSTGMITTVPRNYFNVILFNKVIDERQKMTRKQDIAIAVFFDKNKPVATPSGNLIGYNSYKIGKVFFNGDSAHVMPLFVTYFKNHLPVDTPLGPMYLLRRNLMRMMNPNPIADFNSILNIKIIPDSAPDEILQKNILVPDNLNPSLIVSGKKGEGNLELVLKWENIHPETQIEIIIGGVKFGRQNRMPLLKLRTRDDGEVRIPPRILKSIPFDNFSHMIVTVIRKNELKINSPINNNKTLISTQVIHNLIFDVP